jgi:hypothetical protein
MNTTNKKRIASYENQTTILHAQNPKLKIHDTIDVDQRKILLFRVDGKKIWIYK